MIDVSSRTHVALHTQSGPQMLPLSAFLRSLDVDAVVRLHSTDFAELDGLGRVFVHFNLGTTVNAVGVRYAMLPIVRPGSRESGGREVLPLIDPARFRVGMCVEVSQGVAIDDVPSDHFACSLPSVRTPAALRRTLLARYANVRPGLTLSDVEEQGCAISRFEMNVV